MFIQIEQTPNPETLKFIPECEITDGANLNFTSIDQATNSPLAQWLFRIEGVVGVLLSPSFITITKSSDIEWEILKPYIITTIMDFFASEEQAVIDYNDINEEIDLSDPVVAKIVDIITTKVRPAVAADGGDIIFKDYKDGIVKLEMHGACSGCPSSTITLKNGIENMLRYYVPEVVAVEAV